MTDMIFLAIAAALVAIMGFLRLTQMTRSGVCTLECLTFGVLVANAFFILVYPLSDLALGYWPLGTFGIAFALHFIVRWVNARHSEYPVSGNYRGTVLKS